jgi:hypothetical protein
MVDVVITSLKNRFEELMVFKDLFGFLLSSNTLKSLNDSKLKGCCTKFTNTFSHDGSSNVEVHDLISELKSLKCTLPNDTLSAIEIFQHIRDVDCYPNTFIAYRILFIVHVTVTSAVFKIKIVEELFEITNVTRNIEWFDVFMYS